MARLALTWIMKPTSARPTAWDVVGVGAANGSGVELGAS